MTTARASWFFATLLLASLLLGTSFAHALEMPAKLGYDAEHWLYLQQTLYRSFATLGGAVEIGAIIAAVVLTFLLRGNGTAFLLGLAGVVCFVIAFFGIWVFVTHSVNAEVARWTQQSTPSDWSDWRSRWEYSHLFRFVLHLLGFCAVTGALLTLSPATAEGERPSTRTRVRT